MFYFKLIKMKNIFFYCLLGIFISGCATNKPITSALNPSEIKKVGILKPSGILKILATNNFGCN
jgi:hypothetical protein